MNAFVLILIVFYIRDNNTIIPIPITKCITSTYDIHNIRVSYTDYLGIKYVWGGNSKKGTDCSGLVKMYYDEQLNIKLPRTSYLMSKLGILISKNELAKNDLLFFGYYKVTHVALYIGNNKIIHCISGGSKIDSIGSNTWEKYWSKRYMFSKRL